MTWLQLDDNMPEHPKIVGLSSDAFRLHVRGLAYCCRLLTDGKIPEGAISGLASHVQNPDENTTKIVRELELHHLWRRTKKGITIVDYTDWNPTRKDVEARRQAKRDAGKKGADKRWGDSTSHGTSYSTSHSTSHGNGNAPLHSTTTSSKNKEEKDQKEQVDLSKFGRLPATDPIGRLVEATKASTRYEELIKRRVATRGLSEAHVHAVREAVLRTHPNNPPAYALAMLERMEASQ